MSNVIRFPHSVARRALARRPRRSKNGTPEERAAARNEARQNRPNRGRNPLTVKLALMQICVPLAGKVIYHRHGFDISTLNPVNRDEWKDWFCRGAHAARELAQEFEKALDLLDNDDRLGSA